jgi:hypothetical protein
MALSATLRLLIRPKKEAFLSTDALRRPGRTRDARREALGMAFFDDLLSVTETLGVAFWTGAAAGYAFLAASTVAHEADDLDLQARIGGIVFGRIVEVAGVCEALAIACALVRARGRDERANDATRAVAGLGAIAALRLFRTDVLPEMGRLQQAMGGSFRDVAEDDPRRLAYRAQHKRSTQLYGTALLCGIAQLALGAVRDRAF